ncbi:MAG: glycosyltransferase family 2 protein [Ferruginibacter sp.]|nr:glycosyltransferase family 2 protein [Ferruginibacter sp.]
MNGPPIVSIIMPTYNRAHLIAETIESIRSQTFTQWELLIMDDGSDDNTEEIIEHIKDDRIQFYTGERTGHVSKLKNTAIKKARGELIAFIDSDDLWHPTKLEKQLAAMEQYPEAGFCLTGGYTFINKDEPVSYLYKQMDGLRYGNFLHDMFKSELSGYTQALLFRKHCVDISGYFDEKKLFSDPDFILSLALNFKGVIIYETLFFHRLHQGSDSDKHWEKRYCEWIEVIKGYHKKKYIPASEARKALFKLYINYGEKCLVKKQGGKAIKNFARAWRSRPLSIIPFKKTAKALLAFSR